jgi:3-mercaptopyruvate sulfurtransferase SseA
MENTPSYNMLNAYETIELMNSEKNLVIIDTRTVEVFENRSDKPWERQGHLKNAINIPYERFEKAYAETLKDKTAKIMIYGDEAAECCATLVSRGYQNVNWMCTSMFELRWASANIAGFVDTSPYIVQ